MASSGSKYGLFIPKKNSKGPVLKPASTNIFGDDSDEDSGGASAVNQTINRESTRAKVKKQTQLEIDKALQEDPNVYEYDSIYDNIQAEKVKTDVKEAHKVDRKPKYIAGLLKMAEVRKREEERRVEHKVQKEREEEGNQFADKEAFVTSAYKKKMLEQQAEAERERQQAAMEEMLDVTKQKDLSGFYRYLYRETTGTVPSESQNADEPGDQVKVKEEPHSDAENDNSSSTRVKVKEEPHSEAESDSSSPREKKYITKKDGRHVAAKPRDRRESDDKDDDGKPRHPKSRSPGEKSKSSTSSRRRSRERKHHRHHRDKRSRSRSPSHRGSHKHRHRSRSGDRKRDRSSSPSDRSKQKSRSGERSRPREEEGSSRKEIKKRRHSSGDDHVPSVDKKEAPAKNSSPERASSPEMLPARPPDEDLDRDDSASESESSADETVAGQKGKGQDSENRRRKTAEPEEGGGKKEAEPSAKYGRKTTEAEVSDARQRFLARKLARERARPVTEPE